MFAKVRAARSKTQVFFIHIFFWSLFPLMKTYVGITTSLHHTGQKPMGLPKTELAGPKKVPSTLLVQSGFFSRDVEERSNGMLLLFATFTRQTGRQKVTVREKTWNSI